MHRDFSVAVPAENALLAKLPADELSRVARRLERVTLDHQTLYGPDDEIRKAYFPIYGLISVIAELESGRALEVATVGREGMLGISLLMGTMIGDRRVVSRIPGEAFAMTVKDFKAEIGRNEAFHSVIGRYSLAYMSGLTQTVACNGAHRARRRLARWLLVCQDAACEDDFPMTQDTLAAMLGVQRPTVSLAAESLQRSHAISYRRGHMRILDRESLERSACECYTAVRTEYHRLLS
jgi:CRP-like cAMP-binding protein